MELALYRMRARANERIGITACESSRLSSRVDLFTSLETIRHDSSVIPQQKRGLYGFGDFNAFFNDWVLNSIVPVKFVCGWKLSHSSSPNVFVGSGVSGGV